MFVCFCLFTALIRQMISEIMNASLCFSSLLSYHYSDNRWDYVTLTVFHLFVKQMKGK